MPWKLPTWKGLIGIVTLLSGVITALTVSPATLPHNVEVGLLSVGGVLIAIERVADAVDFKATAVAPTATPQAPPPGAVPSQPVVVTGGPPLAGVDPGAATAS